MYDSGDVGCRVSCKSLHNYQYHVEVYRGMLYHDFTSNLVP